MGTALSHVRDWRRLLVLGLAAGLAGCATAPKQEPVAYFASFREAMVQKDIVYRVGDTQETVTVPAGFVSDLASMPLSVKWAFTSDPTYRYPAIIHDWLYWEQKRTRAESDRIFLQAMKDSNVPEFSRNTIDEAVRRFGDYQWLQNKKEKARGLPKIVPAAYRPLAPLATWEEYREYLYSKGVRG